MTSLHASLDSALGDALLRATSDAALVVDDASWRVVAFNDAAVRLYGAPEGGLVGVALEAIFGLDGVDAVERAVWRAQTEPELPELELERPDGELRLVRVRARRCVFEGCSVCLLLMRDVTRERLLERRVEEAEAEQRDLLDALGVGLLILDTGGRILRHNRFAPLEEAFGATLVGRNFFLDVAPSAGVRPVFQRFHTWVTDFGGMPYAERFEFETGRRAFDAEIRVGMAVGGGAAIVRVADATERRLGEEQLRKQTFQAEEAARHASLVNQTVSLIHGSLDLNDVLATAVGETGRLLGVSRCQVIEIGPDGLVRVAHEYTRAGLEPSDRFEAGLEASPLVAEVARTLQPLAVERVEGHPLGDRAGLLAASSARSTAAAPIALRREPRGVLAIHQCDRERRWSGAELDVVAAIANQVSLAIGHAEIHERLRKQADREAIASRLAASLHAAASLDEALELAVRTLTGVLGALRVTIAWRSAGRSGARGARSWRREGEDRVVEEEAAPEAVAAAEAALAAGGEAATVRSAAGAHLLAATLGAGRGSAESSGFVAVERVGPGTAWDADETLLVRAIAGHLGVAIGAATLLQAIVSAKRMWEGTFDAMSDGIVVHDDAMRIVRVNRAFARLARSGPARLVGRRFTDLVEAASAASIAHACERVAATRRSVTVDIDEPALGGTVSISVSRLQTGEGAYFIHTLRDITDQRQMQERLAQASKMATLGHLASGVAHEINTPLATITGCAQSLTRQLASVPELSEGGRWDAINERLATIVEQSFRCKRITRDLLGFAKPTKPTLVPTDLDRVAREAVETVERERESGRITVRLAGDPATVLSDPDLVRQILINLVVNALDATEERKGAAVVVETRHLKRSARVRVRDNGTGIAPVDLERVFDPFFTTKPPGRGTGLGLSISQSLASSLGGRIEVSSRVGKGSAFTVALPRESGRGR